MGKKSQQNLVVNFVNVYVRIRNEKINNHTNINIINPLNNNTRNSATVRNGLMDRITTKKNYLFS